VGSMSYLSLHQSDCCLSKLVASNRCSMNSAQCLLVWSRAHLNKAVFEGGSPELGESQGLGESLRLSTVIGERFRGVLHNMKEL